MSKSILITLLLALMIAGCSTGGDGDSSPEPVSTTIAGPGERENIELPDAPQWVEAQDVITLETIPLARYIGRLDAPNAMSTVFAFDLSPDSTVLAGLNNDSLILWDMITGEVRFSNPHNGAIEVFYSSEGSELYTIDSVGRVRVYNGQTGQFIDDFLASIQFNNTFDHLVDLDLLAVGGAQGEVKVWDTFERLSLTTFQTNIDDIRDVALSPNGTTIAVAGQLGTVEIWDWQNRERITTLDNDQTILTQIAYSPDGAMLAVGLDEEVNVYPTETYEIRFGFRGTGAGAANDVLLFSPDGQYLVHGGLMPDMLIWNVQTGARQTGLPGVGGDRVSAAFSPDSDILITTVLDGAVSVWDMTSIDPDAQTIVSAGLDVQTDRILFVDWSDDGFVMLFFDALGPIYVWGIGETGESE